MKQILSRARARGLAAAVVAAALVWAWAPALLAGDDVSPAERYFTNVELINQNGEPMRLYRDLLQGKVVVISTMFTECTAVCPMMSKTIERIQEHLGDRVGDDVHLISISVDPENDTPEKLKEYASRFHAKPGWYFLTGKKESVDQALYKLGGYVENRDDHQTLLIIGNEPTGLWKKALGLAGAEKILPIVDSVLEDQGAP
jgi:cytochrome oxidase Cu insertion factor (SCO1/SenC/PrrC family)